MGKELEGPKKILMAKIHHDSLRATKRIVPILKKTGQMADVHFSLKNYLPTTTDWQSK